MGRQRLLRGGCTDGRARARCAGTANICDTTSTGQLLQFGLEPLDLPVQLLGLAAELHPFEFVDLRLELFDLDSQLGKLGASLDRQGFERIDIIRKLSIIGHAPEFTRAPKRLQHRQRRSSTRLSPIDALE